MRFLRSCSLFVASAVLTVAVPMLAQGAPGGQRPPQPPPTNLKVLPKDTSSADVIKMMRGFTGDLGVECGFCHAQNETTKRLDPPSDKNPVKETARFMIAMTDDLNKKYLEQMPDRRYADPITCGTCHRGESHPSVFVPKPRQPGPPPGAAGAAPGAAPAAPPK
jgi:Photosynthetic reaction centre cytochrome C subunit